jgi:hypothetical protein
MNSVNPEHTSLWNDALRAPSAHNAQPWRVHPLEDSGSYEIHYDQHPGLPTDHDNKDAYLTMGAFVETMVLQAPNHGLAVDVSPELTRNGQDIYIARVAVRDQVETDRHDPLSEWVGLRSTNRNRYTKEPLPAGLEAELEALGNSLVKPAELEDLLLESSMRAWGDPKFVSDLENWFRTDKTAPDGLTAWALHVDRVTLVGLGMAFRRGGFKSAFMQKAFSSSEVAAFNSAPAAAVLGTPDMEPATLFDAGRRLLRSWVTITAHGYSCQPYSVAVDDRVTGPRVAEVAGVENAVALYRIGKSPEPAHGPSGRRPLSDVLI